MLKNNELTIRMTAKADNLSVKSFMKTVNEAIKVLNSVAEKINDTNDFLNWRIVYVKMESPLEITLDTGERFNQDIGSKIINASVNGIRRLEDVADMPEYFDINTIRYAKELVKPLNNGIEDIELITNEDVPIKPTQHVAANADLITKSITKQHLTWTTIEGMLDFADVHGKYEFKVFDLLTDEAVKCTIPAQQFEEAKMALGKRVFITGEAKYNNAYKLQSIYVKKIDILPTDDNLPTIEQLKHLNITGGIDANEYLERLNYGEET